MLTSINSPKQITLEEFLQLPETKPASEYINNQIYQKSMPQGEHSAIQACLSSAINQAGEPQKLAMAFTELRCIFVSTSPTFAFPEAPEKNRRVKEFSVASLQKF